ncbi:MAG: filamentous hemagglutinin N-terminal domain-containing protein, partial [Candidatus Gastranaerophilales bacterium]|nr:filamentous hemagglutinin N-terminal domain-containing protein [Candidatus Gastranaerophilales bacterium]
MKKFMTKLLSVVLCIAFTGLQMSFADVLTTGTFANKDVLTGAQIKGHTAGLTNITTNAELSAATLTFSANTRIDWNTLNVYKNQSLTFNNGTYGVLNNVVGTSISKFAGTITATGTGKIIISNPNGILFEGGKFESLGGLVLTTKDLTSISVDSTTDLENLDLDSAAYGEDFAIVAITNSSNISAADINIISQGIYVDSSTLASSNSNGIVLSTADGSTFVASNTLTADDGTSTQISFSGNYSLSVANSAITTTDGTLQLISGKGLLIDDTTIDGDLTATSSGYLYMTGESAVNGDASLTSTGSIVDIYGTGSKNISFGGDLTVKSSTSDVYIDNIDVAGDINVSGIFLSMGGLNVKGNGTFTDTKQDAYGIWLENSTIGGFLIMNAPDGIELEFVNAGFSSITSTNTYIRLY